MKKLLSNEQIQLLNLVKISLHNEAITEPLDLDYKFIAKLAKDQGVTAFVYDSVTRAGLEIPSDINQRWTSHIFSSTLQNERLLMAQDSIVRRFKQANIPVAVLKGSSTARYYPQPELRALGDIDLLINKSDLCAARNLLLEDGYAESERNTDFHTAFSKKGISLELHEQVTVFPDTPGGQAAKEIANGFLQRIDTGAMYGYEFPVLSKADQALSLLLHMVRHLFEGGIGLRQLCDWMVFAAKEGLQFPENVFPALAQCGLLEFAKISTKVCVQHLGLDPNCCQWCNDADEQSCELLLNSVFSGGNMGSADPKAMGSLFTDEKSMGESISTATSFIRKMNRISYKNFPFVKRFKILLPLVWMYLPIRYFVRSISGIRKRKSLRKMLRTANRQRKLFKKLHLFEV